MYWSKSDPSVTPDTYQKMNMKLITKLTKELKAMKYKGSVVLCGYGEPMSTKIFMKFLEN